MNVLEESFDRDLMRQRLLGILSLIWCIIRLPVVALLAILEPIVSLTLSLLALLLALCAFFFKIFAHRPDFPFWMMLGFSVCCVFVLAAYYGIMRMLSR